MLLRFTKLIFVFFVLSLAGNAYAAGGMEEFLDGKAKVKSPVIAASKSAASSIGGSPSVVIGSKQQLAAIYTRYHNNSDCEGLKSLVNWEGVTFWAKEGFTDLICSNGYKSITGISFKPVDAAKLAAAQANIISPEAIMLVKFEPQKYARSTAPGDSPRLEFVVGKNKNGSYVIIAKKNKAN